MILLLFALPLLAETVALKIPFYVAYNTNVTLTTSLTLTYSTTTLTATVVLHYPTVVGKGVVSLDNCLAYVDNGIVTLSPGVGPSYYYIYYVHEGSVYGVVCSGRETVTVGLFSVTIEANYTFTASYGGTLSISEWLNYLPLTLTRKWVQEYGGPATFNLNYETYPTAVITYSVRGTITSKNAIIPYSKVGITTTHPIFFDLGNGSIVFLSLPLSLGGNYMEKGQVVLPTLLISLLIALLLRGYARLGKGT